VTVKTCAGAFVPGETVTVTKGTFTATCTTDASGTCCVDVSSAGSGTYTVSCSKAGYTSQSKTVAVTCPGTTAVSLTSDPVGNANIKFSVYGCGSMVLPGATVTIGGGSYTTDSSGVVLTSLPPGTYPYTVAFPPRFVSQSGSLTVGCSPTSGNTFTLLPAAGYVCCGITAGHTPMPMKSTLNVSDSGGAGTADASTCLVTWCPTRTLDNYSPTCSNAGCLPLCCGIQVPPFDIGTGSDVVKYQISLAAAGTFTQKIFGFTTAYFYRSACMNAAQNGCAANCIVCTNSAADTRRTWRGKTPADWCTTDYACFTYSGSIMVSSYFPFAATITFTDGTGFKSPPDAGNSGHYFSPTITIGE
jgi:hypothetical protein